MRTKKTRSSAAQRPRWGRVLVTGATGFLGGAVARSLHAQGHGVLAHGRDAAAAQRLSDDGIEVALASLEDPGSVAELFTRASSGRAIDAVVHCAAKSAPFGRLADFVKANVDGTRHILEASRRVSVERFVHISSPSIYCQGAALDAVREDAPLPARAINHYATTKRQAEELVQAAHVAGLAAVTLRPRAIYGPGDNALFPRLLTALDAGRLPVIGDGKNRIDLTFIDDAVHAVHCALVAEPHCFGGAFNVTSGEPVALWDLIADLCKRLNIEAPTRTISHTAARRIAAIAETAHRVFRRSGEPVLTRYSVDSLSLDATLDISAARRDLSYTPKVSVAQGVDRFLASLRGTSRSQPTP